MTFASLKPVLACAAVAASFAFVAACSGTSPSMNPTAPTAAVSAAAAGANFSPNPHTCEEDPSQPICQPPTGTPCSPGYWKNHQETWVGIYCTDATAPSCGTLLTALTCRGSDASCGRSAAAAFLNSLTACTETN